MASYTITLEDELGIELEHLEETQQLTPLLGAVADKALICLRFIDPNGITVFNRLQMQYLVSELSLLMTKATSKQDSELIGKLIEMARRCKQEAGTYLYFYGNGVD
jgi:hypothetical protein